MHRITRRQALHRGLAPGFTAAVAPALAAPGGKDEPLLDCHVHLTHGWYGQELEPITVPHLLHWMDAHGIAQAVVLPLVSPEAFWYPVTTEFVLAETAPHRDRLIPFCAVDPRTLATHLTQQREMIDLLRRYMDAGAKGLGEHKPRLAIDDPLSMRLYEACGQLGLPVLFHTDYYLTSQVDFQQFTMFDELGATAEVRRKVGYENARRVLHLKEAN